MESKPLKWEYKISNAFLKADAMPREERLLNELGEEGWELAGFTSGNSPYCLLIFKRPKI